MPNEVLPYLVFLFAIILINMVINFIAQLNAKEKIFKELLYYWSAVLFILLSEGLVTTGKLGLSLIFLSNFPAIYILAKFILRPYSYKIGTKAYLWAIPIGVSLTFIFNYWDAPFVITSLPIVLINCAPFVEALYIPLVVHRKESRVAEKIIGSFVSILGISCVLNYGLNRYNPTYIEYIVGFGSAFFCYFLHSILLPIYCIQQINRKKTDLLNVMVKEKTRELIDAKNEKEKLLAVLMHDISNPLYSATYSLQKAVTNHEYERLNKSLDDLHTINEIITHVREYECVLVGNRTMELKNVYLQDCLEMVEQLFINRFSEKNITLTIINNLPAETIIRVDKTSFVHSIASNLISNSLKFSKPNSEVQIVCYERDSEILIEFIDHGIGMPTEALDKIFDIGTSLSRIGTNGERGSGFGLPIVKAYVSLFGGKVEVSSSEDKENSGTTFTLHLPHLDIANHTYLQ